MRRTEPARRGTKAAAPAARALEPEAGSRLPGWAWFALGACGLLALLAACRGAPFGVAVADDYSFLDHLRFHRPLTAFDSFGGAYYWRPLARQLYFLATGGWLLQAPALAAALHAALLLALYALLYRVARAGFAPPVAAAIAAFPLVNEAARVLLVWPSGSQHLLASVAVAGALARALAGDSRGAALCAFAGLLCHESAALALPLIPAIAWHRDGARAARRAALNAVTALALWAAGYRLALAHGVVMPASTGYPFARLPELFGRALGAALQIEALPEETRPAWIVAEVALVVFAIVRLRDARVRARIAARGAVLAAGLAWFAIGSLPLALLLPGWNAWRDWVPALGFGFTATAFLGLAHPALAGGFVGLRVAALLLAPIAPAVVSRLPPVAESHVSFVQLTRLQRLASSTRRTLLAAAPTLPSQAVVRYWSVPRLAEFAFQGSRALRVWYGDSTLTWRSFGGLAGLHQRTDVLLEFREDSPDPAVVIETRAARDFFHAGAAVDAGRNAEADSLLAAAAATHHEKGGFLRAVMNNRTRIAFAEKNWDRADSLHRVCGTLGGEFDPSYWALDAALAIVHHDRARAQASVQSSLELDPNNAGALAIARQLGLH